MKEPLLHSNYSEKIKEMVGTRYIASAQAGQHITQEEVGGTNVRGGRNKSRPYPTKPLKKQ